MERYSASPHAERSTRTAEFRYERLVASSDGGFAELEDLSTAPGKARKREGAAFDDKRATIGAHMLAQLRVRHDALDRCFDCDRIAKTNRKTCMAISDDINRTFLSSRDDWRTVEHCLEKHDAESFLAARQHEGLALLIQSNQLRIADPGHEMHPILDAAAFGDLLQERKIGAVTDD